MVVDIHTHMWAKAGGPWASLGYIECPCLCGGGKRGKREWKRKVFLGNTDVGGGCSFVPSRPEPK